MPNKVVFVPLVVDLKGIARSLGKPVGTVNTWRLNWLQQQEGRAVTGTVLAAPDMTVGTRPLWYGRTITSWAAPLMEGRDLQAPDPETMWSVYDIADHVGVTVETINQRWRWRASQALAANQEPPLNALPTPDCVAGQTPLWYPDTIRRWLEYREAARRADRQGIPTRRQLVARGTMWNRRQVAVAFGVTLDTVKGWRAGRTRWARDFPAEDKPGPLWLPDTIIEWGKAHDLHTNFDAVAEAITL